MCTEKRTVDGIIKAYGGKGITEVHISLPSGKSADDDYKCLKSVVWYKPGSTFRDSKVICTNKWFHWLNEEFNLSITMLHCNSKKIIPKWILKKTANDYIIDDNQLFVYIK